MVALLNQEQVFLRVTVNLNVTAMTENEIEIEHYNSVQCRFADLMYQKMMSKRYGISFCCVQEEKKVRVERELLNLCSMNEN